MRITILELAAKAGCDPRTAAKALMYGPGAVRGLPGERLARAMRELGIDPKANGSSPPPHAA